MNVLPHNVMSEFTLTMGGYVSKSFGTFTLSVHRIAEVGSSRILLHLVFFSMHIRSGKHCLTLIQDDLFSCSVFRN